MDENPYEAPIERELEPGPLSRLRWYEWVIIAANVAVIIALLLPSQPEVGIDRGGMLRRAAEDAPARDEDLPATQL